ncbi:hypothetical protein TWF970_005434 [Orbilia oligospora]|uniref:Uncharacterized protein n=1 Tax=Orbilia oligospora TaxID=2813651 RepID=A0A7C8RLA6_ORBOL|nr:hypothetical protein TWF970_005434 [Orbilia oligospora]
MVGFKISAGLALSILINTGEVSAHARLYNNYGDYDQSKLGGSLAHAYDIPVIDHGDHQHPGQWDVKVFSDPVIPATWESPFKHIPRKYMPQGCGADLHFIFAYNMAHRRGEINPGNLQNDHVTLWKHRNYHFFMAPIPQGALVNTKQQIDYNAKHGRIAQVTPGGWLDIRSYQVNADGAGPFKCRLDETSTGQHFSTQLPILKEVPGGPGSINWHSAKKAYIMRVGIPKHIKCLARYGTYNNVCLMRCENQAHNGPFGACIPFQVMYPKPPAAPPKPVYIDVKKPEPEPKPIYGYAGYDVGKGNYKEGAYGKKVKRDIERKKIRRAANAETDTQSEDTEVKA